MSKYKEIKAALLGAGTVGGGVYKLVERRAAEMPDKVGAELKITKVLVKNLQKKREGLPSEVLTDDWEGIIHDPEISIVIELMGGVEPARTYILQALEAGKNVVTANKDLLAEHGQELMEAAERNHCDLCFEAAVGGGIPIIRPLKECLAGNEITEVMGIVNGTTNYILTKMTQEGWDFDDALKEAQRLGFAEADPTADVEGLDAGRKMAILASIAFHSRVTFKDVDVKGITKITAKDIQYAKEFGYTLKLLGVARNEEGKMEVGVSPMMIPSTHPLANVNDSFNAVFVHGNMLGDAMFYGSGAGKLPTASAVVGDIVDAAKHLHTNIFTNWNSTPAKLRPLDQVSGRFFVRVKKEAAEEAKEVFENAEMICLDQLPEECAFITTDMTQGEFCAKAEKLGDKVLAKIRVKD